MTPLTPDQQHQITLMAGDIAHGLLSGMQRGGGTLQVWDVAEITLASLAIAVDIFTFVLPPLPTPADVIRVQNNAADIAAGILSGMTRGGGLPKVWDDTSVTTGAVTLALAIFNNTPTSV